MEAVINKLKAKFKKVEQELECWKELQSQLILQLTNASSIIARLQVLQTSENFGNLRCINCIGDAVLEKQLESFDKILTSMKKTLEGFHGIVLSLDKIERDGRQFVKGGYSRLSVKQQQQHIGIKPSLSDCLDGLVLLHDMHLSEYHLKRFLVSALSALALKPRYSKYCSSYHSQAKCASALGVLQQLLIDQPNIPVEEVVGGTLLEKIDTAIALMASWQQSEAEIA